MKLQFDIYKSMPEYYLQIIVPNYVQVYLQICWVLNLENLEKVRSK